MICMCLTKGHKVYLFLCMYVHMCVFARETERERERERRSLAPGGLLPKSRVRKTSLFATINQSQEIPQSRLRARHVLLVLVQQRPFQLIIIYEKSYLQHICSMKICSCKVESGLIKSAFFANSSSEDYRSSEVFDKCQF